jgi:hypothetical protein
MRTSPHVTRRVVAAVTAATTLLLVLAAPALGAVSFDPADATGHVDKADVLAAFGWREQTFQANARKVTFHLEVTGALSWDCVISGQTTTVVGDVAESRAVDAAAVTTGGRRGTVSGFDLTGYANGSPVGASCPSGSPANVTWSGQHVLYADLRNQSRAIWSD